MGRVAGRILAMLALAISAVAQAGVTTSYTYDALGRLVATGTSGDVNNGLTKTITYDPAGNRQTYTISGGGSGGGSTAVVVDGSFENPPQNGGYTTGPAVNGVAFGGNTGIASNGSDWSFWAAPDGSQEAFMQGGPQPATIAMSVTGLTPGATYSVHFSLAQRSNYPTMPVTVSVDGANLGSYVPGSLSFVPVTSATFTAASSTGTITFSASGYDAYHCVGLDAVSIVPTIPVADASFESPLQNGGFTANPSVTGVTFGGNAGIASNGSAWDFVAAPDGSQEAFLQGGASPATIAMNVTGLTPGATYVVRFSMAQRSGYPVIPVSVSFNGTALGTYTPASTAFAQTTTIAFSATSTSGTLTFSASGQDAYHCAGIDAVAVVPAS